MPSLERSSCSILMQTAGVNAVFDCGPGTMRRLLQAGVTIFEVSHLFLSHFHLDHTGEVPPLLFATKYSTPRKRTFPLMLAGGSGLSAFYNGLKAVYGEWIDPGDDQLILKEFDTHGRDDYQEAAFSIITRPVAHRPESIAFKVSAGNATVVYSGDTDVSENLVTLCRGADLLICEAALPDGLKSEGHLTPSLAGEIGQQAGVKKLVLTHFYPECEKVDIKQQCARTFSGEIILAEDLMRIEI